MRRLSAVLLLLFSAIVFAQVPHVARGATVYIEPMDGYETHLAAALMKEKVPLVLVSDKGKAEFIIKSSVSATGPGQSVVVVNNINTQKGGYAAQLAAMRLYSISLIDAQSSQIVFAHSASKGGIKGTAEDCSRHLKQFIEKQ